MSKTTATTSLSELSAAGYVLVKKNAPVTAAAPAPDKCDDDKGITTDAKKAAPSAPFRAPRMVMGLKMGLKPMKIVLPISFNIANTSANLTAAILTVDVSSSTEWTSLQQLYDEYRLLSGVVKLVLLANAVGFSAPSAALDLCFVVGWDPVDQTGLTSVRNGVELAQHLLIVPETSVTSATLITVNNFNPSTALGHQFRFKPRDKSLSISSAGAVTAAAGSWKQLPTAGSNGAPDGFLKFYNYNANNNGILIGGGVLLLEVELRSRK